MHQHPLVRSPNILSHFGSRSRFCGIGLCAMALEKSNTAQTLKSKEWSTEAMTEGFAHVLSDVDAELPDDLDKLQETLCHQIVLKIFPNDPYFKKSETKCYLLVLVHVWINSIHHGISQIFSWSTIRFVFFKGTAFEVNTAWYQSLISSKNEAQKAIIKTSCSKPFHLGVFPILTRSWKRCWSKFIWLRLNSMLFGGLTSLSSGTCVGATFDRI